MNINIEKYKTEIEEYKNIMLNEYKNLVEAYENSREIYEKMTTATLSVQKCSEIKAKNGAPVIVKWALIKTDGVKIYETSRYTSGETCTIDLTKKSMVVGTQFKLKAEVTVGDDDTSEIILEYDPEGPIALFKLRGSTFKTTLAFEGTEERVIEE